MSKPVILIVDDEPEIRKLLSITLVSNGYWVQTAHTASDAETLIRETEPDLVLLDLGLPDRHGLSVLQTIREWFRDPVIVISVQDEEDTIVQALDFGANDYLTKPFRSKELLARVRAALRNQPQTNNFTFTGIDLHFDAEARLLEKKGRPVKLTSTEFDLFLLLARNEGRVLTHQFILKHIWGPGYIRQTQYLRVFIAQLRKKIENNPDNPEYILTESGVGYRFILKEDQH